MLADKLRVRSTSRNTLEKKTDKGAHSFVRDHVLERELEPENHSSDGHTQRHALAK